jgi:undecaprenyl-diphosphatase
VTVARWLQSGLPGWLDGWFAAMNVLGQAPVGAAAALVVALILLSRHAILDAVLVAGSLTAWAANAALKTALESPRPGADVMHVATHSSGFGFPSAHVMAITVLLTVLSVRAPALVRDGVSRAVFRAALACVGLSMGLARIEAGAHWPSDVAGGYLWGVSLGLLLIGLPTLRRIPLRAPESPVADRVL